MRSVKLEIPGRICLYGDKVDLLGKPVIAATINKFMHFVLESRDDGLVHFFSKEFPDEESMFPITDKAKLFNYGNHMKFWHACLKSLESFIDSGKITGFNASVSTDIPIGAGLSSSAAVSVGFITGLNQLFDLNLSRADIAEHAYNAEHNILGIMCGRMDQYSIAFGGITFISTGEAPRVDVLNVKCLPLVVADSCEPREAKKVLNKVKQELERKNPVYHGAFDIIHDAVIEGRKHLENGCDLQRLGELMTTHQQQENIIGAATAKLNMLCKVAVEHGAFGAKQMGAGGGGCMLALCPGERVQKAVAEAINKAGGKAEIMDIFCYPDQPSLCK
ncbi:MAG: hypothetical protein GYA24_25360 [Candidatus Lokiarchaeota archaeon]|nr:hypothetical protein [Candidatus Lokiarchaeota archaeon]